MTIDYMRQLSDDITTQRYVPIGVTAWLLALAVAVVLWSRPLHSKLLEFSGENTEILQNIVKRQWSQVRVARSQRGVARLP